MGTGLGRHVNAYRGGRRADATRDHAIPTAEVVLRRLEVVGRAVDSRLEAGSEALEAHLGCR